MAVAFVKQATGNSSSSSTSLTCTFASATTAGNLLVLAMAGDKNTGSMTAAGWTQVINSPQTSVSLYLYWRVSTGETSFTITWGSASTAGNTAWIGEYDDTAVPSGTWSVVGSAVQTYSETNATSKATGTTAALTAAGMGVAVAAVDSSQNVTTVGAWGNSYAARYSATGLVGRGAIFVAEKLESAGAAASSTFNYTGTADQIHAGIGVFSKASTAAAPSEGAAAGTVSFAGSTAGKRTPKGSGSGAVAFTGTAAGKRTPKGSGSGAVAFAGSTVGRRTPKGSAAGVFAYAGSAVGARTAKGAASGGVGWAGTAASSRRPVGAAAGAVVWGGAAAGARSPVGGTAGAVAWGGSAAGASVRATSTAVDKFAAQDEALWSGWGPNVGVVDGHLRIIPTASYPVLWSVAQYDLRGSHFHAELVELPAAGAGTIEAQIIVELDNGNQLQILWANNWLGFRSRVGGSNNDTGFGYSPTDHRWVRISEAAGVVVWSTSPDGVAWTERRSLAAPFDVSRVRLVIASGWWGTETGDPGAFRVDNVNASPPAQGAAGGAVGWGGAAEGGAPTVAEHSGSALGVVVWEGASAGSRPAAGQGGGGWSVGGSSVGWRAPVGAAAGMVEWGGSAAGAAPQPGGKAGTAQGVVVWGGAAVGAPARRGESAGAFTYAGTAGGRRRPQGGATGGVVFTGAAAGRFRTAGSASGGWHLDPAAAGRRAPVGASVGAVSWSGVAVRGATMVLRVLASVGARDDSTALVGGNRSTVKGRPHE